MLQASLLTRHKSREEKLIDDFFAKMHTQVETDPQVDIAILSATVENHRRDNRRKLFRQSDWEFERWNWETG